MGKCAFEAAVVEHHALVLGNPPSLPVSDPDDGLTNLQNSMGLNFDTDILSQELSANVAEIIRLDENMFKLLSDGGSLDHQIADPLTEEHLKS